jgi:hypothetical protein
MLRHHHHHRDDPMTEPKLTDAERVALQALIDPTKPPDVECYKADALLHAACDVVAVLRGDEEDVVLWMLLYVFVERCLRRGENPGEQIDLMLATMDLPSVSQWQRRESFAGEKRGQNKIRDIVVPDFLRECDEGRGEVWHRTKDAALRMLTIAVAGRDRVHIKRPRLRAVETSDDDQT